MMVPRSFASNPLRQKQSRDYDEKNGFLKTAYRDGTTRTSLSFLSTSASPPQSSLSPRSHPVQIPSRATKMPAQSPQRPAPTALQPGPMMLSASQPAPPRLASPHELLSATAIPIRKKPKRRAAQRLPNCDYVADFSKLLLDDVKHSNEGSLSGSLTNPQFEGLFGNIDELVEGQMFVGSEGLDAGILSTRSMSSESMPSLASPDDFSNADLASVSLPFVRSLSERRMRQIAMSEDASEHPLMDADEEDEEDRTTTPELMMLSTRRKPQAQPMQETRTSSFKSSLTASLKAIKSAAQSVSNYAITPPIIQPDDFLTHSFFDIQPSLTDDRRPPPSDKPPSPALRRYLNPNTSTPPDSPAQLHFWLDDKHTANLSASSLLKDDNKHKLRIKKKYLKSQSQTESEASPQLPPIVPLATCIPPAIRTAHASSPPIWLAPDGTPSNKHTAPAVNLFDEGTGLRQREPRENRDFLRVFVVEMQMRRSGKLEEAAPGRAVLWLPPVKEPDGARRGVGRDGTATAGDRWKSWLPDES